MRLILKFSIFCLVVIQINICFAEYRYLDWQRRVSFGYGDFHQLLMGYNVALHQTGWGGFTRSLDPLKPGDYFADLFSQPRSIDSSTLNVLTKIYNLHFKNLPIDLFRSSLLWYSDTFNTYNFKKTIVRDEYFFRYTDGACVYVLSGWWPNFIKFYKAYPGDIRLDIVRLNKEVSHFIFNDSVLKGLVYSDTSSAPFFLTQARSVNLLIRHYNINAMHVEGRLDAADLNQPPPMFASRYSIIEITYYLNKDFIP